MDYNIHQFFLFISIMYIYTMEKEYLRHQENKKLDIPSIRLSQTDQDYEGYGWGSIIEGDIVIANGHSEYRSYGGYKLYRREELTNEEMNTLKELVDQFVKTNFKGVHGHILDLEEYKLTVGDLHVHAFRETDREKFPDEFWKLIGYLNKFFLPTSLRNNLEPNSNFHVVVDGQIRIEDRL